VQSPLPIILITHDRPDILNTAQAFNITVDGLNLQTDLPLKLDQQLALELETSSGKLKLEAIVRIVAPVVISIF